MGRLIRDNGVVTLDYVKQPLPLFAIWSNYSNSTYGAVVVDSDGIIVNEKNNTSGAPLGISEFYNNWAWAQTDARASTSSSNGAWVKFTCASGVDGNMHLAVYPDARFNPRGGGGLYTNPAYSGVVVGPEGYRQNYSLFQQGYVLRQMVRGAFQPLDQYTISSADATMFASTGSNSGNGQIAYHRPLNKLIWMEPKDGSGSSYRLHIWRNPNRKLTGRPAELRFFITEAKASTNGASYTFADFTWPTNNAGDSEAYYRARIIPSTNDNVYAISRFCPSNRIEFANVTTTVGSNSASATIRGTIGTTTSYGLAQGAQFGMRHQISWDNKWVVTYAPYYYYGSGMVCFLISVDDPTVYYTYTNTGSADGVQIMPYSRSGFILGDSAFNADGGPGMYTGIMDGSTGYTPTNTVLSSGGAITPQFNPYMYDTYYTSTNYPCLVPVERWGIPGAGYV